MKKEATSIIYDYFWQSIRKIIDGIPVEKVLQLNSIDLSDSDKEQLRFLINKTLKEKPNLSYEDLPLAYRPKILASYKSHKNTASCNCGGFKPPKGHLDTQMFPECAGTECDRDIVKKTEEKRKKEQRKKKSFNLKYWKTAQKLSGVKDPPVPVEEILGTRAEGTLEQIDKDMHNKGYFLFREHYYFGTMLSYKNVNNEKIYLLNGVWVTWNDVVEDLRETWRPVGEKELSWYYENIANWKN